MKLSVFGSCRQNSLKNNYQVTHIQEQLTYPHYTKEIIQAIEYSKGVSKISYEESRYAFRTGILENRCINNDTLVDQYNSSDFIVVEIASRKYYKYKGVYVHHILKDDNYLSVNKDDIETGDLSDVEIENDLLRIRELLYPKPFLVVSHFSTYEHGKRYELIRLLEKLCDNMNINFYNPSNLLKEYSIDQLFISEKIISHYTKLGEHVISAKYKDCIDIICNNESEKNRRELTQLYHASEDRSKKYSFQGLGDYIRGTIFLYDFCKNNNRIFSVNFTNHLLSEFVYCRTHRTIEEANNTTYVAKCFNQYDLIYTTNNVFTNEGYTFELTDEIKQFIIKASLTPRINLTEYINTKKMEYNLVNGKYTVIHIRMGDTYSVEKGELTGQAMRKIMFIESSLRMHMPNKEESIVISDTLEVEHIFKSLGYKSMCLNKAHLGHHNINRDGVRDTLIEFFIMTTANRIIQFSEYGWGSGFSDTVSKIYNIPIGHISLE